MEIDLKKPGALNRQAVRQLIASVNDSVNVQLRVTLDGIAFISTTHVGNQNTEGLLFRLETWCAGNDYVGLKAASDDNWVNQVFNDLKENWPNPTSSFIGN
ncbi:hypothetical protein IIE18_13545 [Pseudomonas sp. V1]|uniref:hypothetical protein n=1 Tax=Pseudomonas arcuscaelestis TaxID=2710591 RepID=UPI0019400D52|nr:hypothetical protein [Pseudomonas arcuscaelestis]MBM3106160.1 hypothetical protein [Pseudomonas arcuscaelestis]